MIEEAAHRLSIYLTHEETKMLAQLMKVVQESDQRGKTSMSYVVAVAIRRMHKDLFGKKEK